MRGQDINIKFSQLLIMTIDVVIFDGYSELSLYFTFTLLAGLADPCDDSIWNPSHLPVPWTTRAPLKRFFFWVGEIFLVLILVLVCWTFFVRGVPEFGFFLAAIRWN